ncbi:MAG: dTDP-4-dehydrorhamnose reductase [Candidatus Cloacimonetes bacterium]|nr:dTDP-4-dehydrorhamnose reductase [Candidatus Cloacimonadota bacterium]
MPHYLITGAGGMLAHAFRTDPDFADHVALSHSQLDITDGRACHDALRRHKPAVVLNCAAFTDVTAAQQDPREAYRVNADGPRNLADACRAAGCRLVHFSTDYVFPGTHGGYRETDPTLPVNRYGASKLEGEELVRGLLPGALIVRVSWLFGPGGHNFVSAVGSWLLERDEVRIVDDQFGKVTYTRDVAQAVLGLLRREAAGVFHYANAGRCSRFEFTVEMARLLSEKHMVARVSPTSADAFPDPTPRPTDSSMSTHKYERFTGSPSPSWQNALQRYLKTGALPLNPTRLL